MPNYYKMVEEIAELVDGGMEFDKALNKVRKKHKLGDEETEHLAGEYWCCCYEEEADDFNAGAEQALYDFMKMMIFLERI